MKAKTLSILKYFVGDPVGQARCITSSSSWSKLLWWIGKPVQTSFVAANNKTSYNRAPALTLLTIWLN